MVIALFKGKVEFLVRQSESANLFCANQSLKMSFDSEILNLKFKFLFSFCPSDSDSLITYRIDHVATNPAIKSFEHIRVCVKRKNQTKEPPCAGNDLILCSCFIDKSPKSISTWKVASRLCKRRENDYYLRAFCHNEPSFPFSFDVLSIQPNVGINSVIYDDCYNTLTAIIFVHL